MLSRDPTDALIRALIATGRAATPAEVAAIVARMASAPFDGRELPVPPDQRGLIADGRPLGTRADSLRQHLARRIVIDQQWTSETTTADYLADLRAAILVPGALLAVYSRRGGMIAAILADTAAAVPVAGLGPGWLPAMLIVYSVDRGVLITGYQCTSLATTGIPQEVRWLT